MMDPYAAADRVTLYITRALAMADVTEPTDRVAVLAIVRDRLSRALEGAIDEAVDDGTSFAAIARLVDQSRQAIRQQHLRRHPPAWPRPAPRPRPRLERQRPDRGGAIDNRCFQVFLLTPPDEFGSRV